MCRKACADGRGLDSVSHSIGRTRGESRSVARPGVPGLPQFPMQTFGSHAISHAESLVNYKVKKLKCYLEEEGGSRSGKGV